ncbi:MAG: tetratricopeptide repeat protein [Planctomycetes bacterium]|nr:tetratricopeptide repeat protein [Planctomycetota bacterium]
MGIHIAHWKINGRTLAPLELNEVMYTLELGIVTAGFIFMVAAFVSAAVFGRFFCSWGCHILALEDLCAWLLGRVRIRPKPVRSRVLLLVPPAAFFYMFVWPQVQRLVEGRPMPAPHVLTDAGGWASFVTTDFTRNLPGPWIALITFAVCGFVIVYLLGSRSFCRYGCPYGVVFSLADRIAPGRIVLKGECTQSGHCTAACPSQVRVHEEIGLFRNVVDSGCLKCLACVSACPNQAIGFGFTRPSLGRSFTRTGRRAMPADFTFGEEVLMAGVFVATLGILRGLYDAVPFLLTLALGAVFAYAAAMGLRLVCRPHARIGRFQLKLAGRVTPAGRVYGVVVLLLAAFLGHSGFIRYHEVLGARGCEQIGTSWHENPSASRTALLAATIGHLETAGRWGLVRSPLQEGRLAALHVALGETLGNAGQYERGVAHFQAALEIEPDAAAARYNLAVLLAALGRRDDAIDQYRLAARLDSEDADIRNNLGYLLLERGEPAAAVESLRRAIELRPAAADPHFNLGRALMQLGREPEARAHLRQAAELDPRYASILSGPSAPAAADRQRHGPFPRRRP